MSLVDLPLFWKNCDAQKDDRGHLKPEWDLVAQPAPDYEVDQRSNWWGIKALILQALRGFAACAAGPNPSLNQWTSFSLPGPLKLAGAKPSDRPTPMPNLSSCN